MKTKSKMSIGKKLTIAISMSLVAASMFTTASYAWFSRNRSTETNGLGFSSKLTTSMLIAKGYTTDDEKFNKNYTEMTKGAFLQPVSSANATSFFYNSDLEAGVNGIGATSSDADFKKLNDDDLTFTYDQLQLAMLGIVNEKVSAYVDYTYTIKVSASNSSGTPDDIYLQAIALAYSGKDKDASKAMDAFRVAIFTQEYNATTDSFGDFNNAVNHGILTREGAKYFEDGKAISGETDPSNKAVVHRDNIKEFDNQSLRTVAYDTTSYFALTIRIWLEGEDRNCNVDTFRALTKEYTLTVKVGLEKPDAPVKIGTII